MRGGILTAVAGAVVFVVGLVIAGIVNTQAATSGSAANIGSFAGVRSFNDLLPLIFYIGLLVIGLGRTLAPLYRKIEMLCRQIRGKLNWLGQYANPEPSRKLCFQACVETRGLPTFQGKVERIVQAQLKSWGNLLMLGGGYAAYKSGRG